MKFRSAHMTRAWEWTKHPRPLVETRAKVSVIVPISGMEYAIRLKRCLKSIRRQTVSPSQIEIVVVCLMNDGLTPPPVAPAHPTRSPRLLSREETVVELKKITESFGARVLFGHKEYSHYPLCLAKNIGLVHASHEFICFTDADILFDPEVTQRALTSGVPFSSVLASYLDANFDYEHIINTNLNNFRRAARTGSISRSGYGGFLLVPSQDAQHIRGFDEEYDTAWGADDSDIVDRLFDFYSVQFVDREGGNGDYCDGPVGFADISYKDAIFVIHHWHQPTKSRLGIVENRLRYESATTIERNPDGFGELEVVEL